MVHDVIVGQNVALGTDDYSRTEAFLAAFLGNRRVLEKVVTKELPEERIHALWTPKLTDVGLGDLGRGDIDHGRQYLLHHCRVAAFRRWYWGGRYFYRRGLVFRGVPSDRRPSQPQKECHGQDRDRRDRHRPPTIS